VLPSVLRFSCRERAVQDSLQKGDLVCEAVSWNSLIGHILSKEYYKDHLLSFIMIYCKKV